MSNQRTLTDIRNEIIRVKGNISALRAHPFTEEDRQLLEPRYTAHLENLAAEEKAFRAEVTEPEILN